MNFVVTLTLLLIIVGGGGGAVGSILPEYDNVYAQSTPNLYVSAADPNGYGARFDNTFGGIQYVEVIVNDPLIIDAGDAMPRVTVNDEKLTMQHGADGSWYGYFADIGRDGNNDGDYGGAITTGDFNSDEQIHRDRFLSEIPNKRDNSGKISVVNTDDVKYVKYLELDDGDEVDVVYHKAGNHQTVTVTYDTSTNNGIELDRNFYPQSTSVYLTVTDHVLNIDPTDKDVWEFKVDSAQTITYKGNGTETFTATSTNLGCDDNCLLVIESSTVLDAVTTITLEETGPNTGVFELHDDSNKIMTTSNAPRGTNTQITYSDESVAVNVRLTTATVNLDIADGIWNSGEKIDLTIVDADQNKDSDAEDDQTVSNPDARIPTFMTGDPRTLMDSKDNSAHAYTQPGSTWQKYPIDPNDRTYIRDLDFRVDDSHRGILSWNGTNNILDTEELRLAGVASGAFIGGMIAIPLGTVEDLHESINDDRSNKGNFTGRNLFNYDFNVFDTNNMRVDLNIHNSAGDVVYFETLLDNSDSRLSTYDTRSGLRDITGFMVKDRNNETLSYSLSSSEFLLKVGTSAQVTLGIIIKDGNGHTTPSFTITEGKEYPIIVDFFSYGFYDDGRQASERIYNQIVRVEVEETGDNTSTFTGTLEYIMINQLNVDDSDTYTSITPIGNEVKFIAFEDIMGSDARVNYVDTNANGNTAVVSDQQDIATSSGVVSMNAETYGVGSHVVITLEDADLNTDPDRADTYTVVMDSTHNDADRDQVGKDVDSMYESLLLGGKSLGMLLEVTFDGKRWQSGTCGLADNIQNGLGATGFTLQETGSSTGVFAGSFAIPKELCVQDGNITRVESVGGKDIGVTYLDFRDASSQIVTTDDSAVIGTNTGSVILDRTVYPVPFGADASDNSSRVLDKSNNTLPAGTVKVYVQVNDPDYNLNPVGQDEIENEANNGPVTITISRNGTSCEILHAGGMYSVPSGENSTLKRAYDDAKKAYDADKSNVDKQTDYTSAKIFFENSKNAQCPTSEQLGALTETSP